MTSNSKWAGASSSSSHLPASSSNKRHPPEPSAEDQSFLWLSTSYNTEGNSSNPLGAVEDFPQDLVGNGGGRLAFNGKPSKAGYYKMASPTFPPNHAQLSSNNAPTTLATQPGRTDNTALSPTSNGPQLESSVLRSSWTSTDSDDSGRASITQSDFEFLTPSFIAIENPPAIGGRADGSRKSGEGGASGGKGGNLRVPGSQRVTTDSQTLGRLHNMDRESTVLPAPSVRSEPQTPAIVEEGIDEYYYIQQPPSSTGLLSPTSTLPLQVKKPAHLKPTDSHRRLPAVPQDVSPQPHQTRHRFYHQPPRTDPTPPAQQQQLRHVRSADTTASAETTTNTTGITIASNNTSSRFPLSSAKAHPQVTSSGTGTTKYPPIVFSDPTLKRKGSNSKTSGYSAASGAEYGAPASVSPNTSVSVSLGGAGGTGDTTAVGSPPTSLTTMLMSGGGRGRGNSASEGKHPYASSSAYEMAVTDYRDESRDDPSNPFPNAYASSSSKEVKDKDQHPFSAPFSAYRAPQHQKQSSLDRDPYARGRGREALTSEGSQSGQGAQQRYGIGTVPSSSKPSPKIPYSKSNSNMGHGGASDTERRYAVHGNGNDSEKGGGGYVFGGRNQNMSSSKEASGISSPGKPGKNERRQSAATLLSLRIRNIYPVPSASNRSSGAGATPRINSKAISSRTSQADDYVFQDGPEENMDLYILRWCGIACLFLLIAGIIPLLGTVYAVVGHAILRAKATANASDALAATGSSAAVESVYLRSMISSSAKAGALGGAILALPVILLVSTTLGPATIAEIKNKLLRWTKATFATSSWADEDSRVSQEKVEKVQQTPTSADIRRNRRASSLWGPSAASISFREQSTTELAINVATNILLALLFLSLGAACAALGATILTPSSAATTNPYLSPSTSALAGLVGGAVMFGGTVIVGGVVAWVVYEGGKPAGLQEQQLAVGSVPVKGVNVGVPIAGGGNGATKSQGSSVQMLSGSTFLGGQPTVRNDGATGGQRWV